MVFVFIGMGVVTVILLAGLVTLFTEGERARGWSNYLMRLRVLAQFITILIALAVIYFARSH